MVKNVAIIGGGLAGAACAYMLAQHNIKATVFEAEDTLASGASGNEYAIFNPRLSALKDPVSTFYSSGFSLAATTLPQIEDVDFQACGTLHLINSEDKERRYQKCVANWGWDTDHMRLLDRDEASEVAGIELASSALYLPDSGYLSPVKLCRAYTEQADIKLSEKVDALTEEGEGWRVNSILYDAVILACATSVHTFPHLAGLLVHTVRGQIIKVAVTRISSALKCNLCYGGYITPQIAGTHVSGSTFQKWLKHTDILVEDNEYILGNLRQAVPSLSCIDQVTGARAALRTSSKDRLPIIGAVPGARNMYVSTAHGSHGVVTSLIGAQLIVSEMLGYTIPKFANTVSLRRFLA